MPKNKTRKRQFMVYDLSLKKRRNRMSQTEANIRLKNSESILKLLELNNDTW